MLAGLLALPVAGALASEVRALLPEESDMAPISERVAQSGNSIPGSGVPDSSPLTGSARFIPPTDDEVGETGSGSTRDGCNHMFAMVPSSSGAQAQQAFQNLPVDRSREAFDLFVYVAPKTVTSEDSIDEDSAASSGDSQSLIVALSDAAQLTPAPTALQKVTPADDQSVILRVQLASSLAEEIEHEWIAFLCAGNDIDVEDDVAQEEIEDALKEIDDIQFGILELADVPSAASIEIETATALVARAQALAAAGFWFDTLAALDDARRMATTPEERALVETNWQSVFESIDWDFEAHPLADVPVMTIEELEAETGIVAETLIMP